MILPDAERLASAFLRGHVGVSALVGDRVYTAYPANAGTAPLVLVQRVGGAPPIARPLVLDRATLQLDAYGGTKAQAHELVATVLDALSELAGVRPEGTVAGRELGPIRWQPDETFTPHRPRYVADVTLYVRPAAVMAGATDRTPAVTGDDGPAVTVGGPG